MKLNKELKRVFENLKIPEHNGYAFCLLWYYSNEVSGLKHFIIDQGIIDLENEEKYRIGLLKLNEDGNLELKYELFEKINNDSYKLFCTKLADTKVINSLGHLNNRQDYSVYSVSKSVEFVWQTLGELDINVAVATVVKYYETAKPAKKIENYLTTGFTTDYQMNF